MSEIINTKPASQSLPMQAEDYALPLPLSMRHVMAEDQKFLDALYADSRPDLQALRSEPHVFASIIAMQQRVQQQGLAEQFPKAEQWLILSQQQPVGRVVLDWSNTDLRIIDIAIATAAQRQGIASALLKAMQHKAAQYHRGMSLAVSHTNAPALALYQNLGFVLRQSDNVFAQMMWSASP